MRDVEDIESKLDQVQVGMGLLNRRGIEGAAGRLLYQMIGAWHALRWVLWAHDCDGWPQEMSLANCRRMLAEIKVKERSDGNG